MGDRLWPVLPEGSELPCGYCRKMLPSQFARCGSQFVGAITSRHSTLTLEERVERLRALMAEQDACRERAEALKLAAKAAT